MGKETTKFVSELVTNKEFNHLYDACKTKVSRKNLFIRTIKGFAEKEKLPPNTIASDDAQIEYLETRVELAKEKKKKLEKKLEKNSKKPYAGMVQLAKVTGQGVPYGLFSRSPEHKQRIDELIADGKLKLINHLNTSHVVLTTGYVVEEDTNPRAICFVRFYLGHDDIFGIPFSSEKYQGKTHREILMLEMKDAYEAWLEENTEKLEITKNL